jgi:hypothetical protein
MHLFIFQEVGYRHNFDLVEAEAKSEKVNDSQHDGRLRWGSSLAREASRQRGATPRAISGPEVLTSSVAAQWTCVAAPGKIAMVRHDPNREG